MRRLGFGLEYYGRFALADLQEFVARTRRVAQASEPRRELEAVLGELVRNPWPDWATLKEGQADALLFESDDLTIYLIRGEPLRRYPPHEHCMVAGIAMLEGTETNRRYRETSGGTLAEVDVEDLTAPRVLVLDDDAIHSIEYRHDEPVFAVHVYLGDLTRARRRLWDLDGKDVALYDQARYDSLAIDL